MADKGIFLMRTMGVLISNNSRMVATFVHAQRKTIFEEGNVVAFPQYFHINKLPVHQNVDR